MTDQVDSLSRLSTITHADGRSTTAPADQDDVVLSPSLSSCNALARFEFEAGRSTEDGTKVLMVTWRDDELTSTIQGDWTVSWDGKRTVLPARKHNQDLNNRLYFLLAPGERVPGIVTLELESPAQVVTWKTNALPAIFPLEMGASAIEAGKKGVLHTVWAKKRLQVLRDEIRSERARNDDTESVALQMASSEKEWIEENFGVVVREQTRSTSPDTSPGESENQGLASRINALSPEESDIAVSSFGHFAAIKGVADAEVKTTSGDDDDDDDKDGLFALPLSPRNPSMAKSPFSFESAGEAQARA